MGCSNSKRLEAAVAADVYHPPPTSIAFFDITKIDEPWLLTTADVDVDVHADKKPSPMSLSLLDKLDSFEIFPKSWSEISKALEDLKPSLHQTPPPLQSTAKNGPNLPRWQPPELAGIRSVKENCFVKHDRELLRRWKRRDPLEGFAERRPPGNYEGIVLYTTTLRGVRRTFEDCRRLRQVVEGHALEAGLEVDERDVSLHGEYLREMRELVGEGAAAPRLFVAGKYVGGIEEVSELAETGKLGEMMRWVAGRAGGEKGKGGRKDCDGCGGARFVPCAECGGSCKVLAGSGTGAVRCGKCNENGLSFCPMCH